MKVGEREPVKSREGMRSSQIIGIIKKSPNAPPPQKKRKDFRWDGEDDNSGTKYILIIKPRSFLYEIFQNFIDIVILFVSYFVTKYTWSYFSIYICYSV